MKLIAATLFVCGKHPKSPDSTLIELRTVSVILIVATLALMHSVYGATLPQLKAGGEEKPADKLANNVAKGAGDDYFSVPAIILDDRAPAPAPSPAPAPAPEPSGPTTAASAPGPNADPLPASAPQPEMGAIESLVLDEVAEDMPAGPSPMDGAIAKASEK